MSGSTNKGSAASRQSSELANTRQNNPNHDGFPQGYNTIKLLLVVTIKIICSSTTWKVLSDFYNSILITKLSKHMRKAQKGIGNNTKETKHQILVDRAVFYDFKMRQTNLSTTWTDFKNTCDSVLYK